MFTRAHLRRGLKALALILVAALGACTAQSSVTGPDDDGSSTGDQVIDASRQW